MFLIILGRRAIEALKVKCESNDLECDWEGILAMLDQHLSVCEYTLVPCPNQCLYLDSTIRQYMRKDLDQHVENVCPNRDFKCGACGE